MYHNVQAHQAKTTNTYFFVDDIAGGGGGAGGKTCFSVRAEKPIIARAQVGSLVTTSTAETSSASPFSIGIVRLLCCGVMLTSVRKLFFLLPVCKIIKECHWLGRIGYKNNFDNKQKNNYQLYYFTQDEFLIMRWNAD